MNSLTLAEILARTVTTLTAKRPVSDAIEIMIKEQLSSLIIVDDNHIPIGIFTERDSLKVISGAINSDAPLDKVMSQKILTGNIHDEIHASYILMSAKGYRHLIVVDDEGKLEGVVTQGDFLRHIGFDNIGHIKSVSDVMTKTIVMLAKDDTLAYAASQMAEHSSDHAVIVEKMRPIGLITERDILRYASSENVLSNDLVWHICHADFPVISESSSLPEATLMMEQHSVHQLIIADETGNLTGLLTRYDLLQAMHGSYFEFLIRQVDNKSTALSEFKNVYKQIVKDKEELTQSEEKFRTLFDMLHRRKDGSLINVQVIVSTIIIRGESYFLAHISDITDKKIREHRLSGQLELLGTLATNLPMEKLLGTIAFFVEGQCQGIKCSILLVDETTNTLRNGSAPSLPDEYNNLVEGLPIAVGNGSCGTACATGMPVIVTDVYTDPLWGQYKELIVPFGWLRGCWSTPFFDTNKKVLGTFAFYSDSLRSPTTDEQELMTYSASLAGMVVERFVRQKAYAKQATFLHTLINTIPDLIWLKDSNGAYLTCNPMFERFYNASEEMIIGKTDYDFVDKELADFFRKNDAEAMLADKLHINEEYLTFGDGSFEGMFETTKMPMKDASGEIIGVLGVARNITERKEHEAKLERMANYDSLTGLANRSLFQSHLKRTLDKARRKNDAVALLMFDLDRFKDVNDSFGHSAGDELLILVSQRFSQRLREEDMISRLGGDEFAIVLEQILHPQDAARLSEEIIETLSVPFILSNGVNIHIGVSVGIVLFPDHGKSVEELVQHADAALYRAKNDGRSTYRYYTDELTHFARERILLESKLRQGIDNTENFAKLKMV
jgi:diguanylate cyclase (GGDEF)-like protein/PAS domain S-box-containing protein